MNANTISIPTREGWRYAESSMSFSMKQKQETLYAAWMKRFALRDRLDQCERGQEIILLAGGEDLHLFGVTSQGDQHNLERYFLALAPHVLRAALEQPDQVSRTEDEEINVTEWRKSRAPRTTSLKNLPADLDGGQTEYNRLCREDILRILLKHYEEAGPCSALRDEEIADSPLKRRYYDLQAVSRAIQTLRAEERLTGSMDTTQIVPECADEIRDQVEEIERRALGARPAGGIFAPGERSQAWQELRRIVKSAAKHMWIEDAWLGSDVVALLGEDLPEGVQLRVLGPEVGNRFWKGALASFKRLGADLAGRIEIRVTTDLHDRHVYVDNHVWRFSESPKDMGAKRTAKIIDEGDRSAGIIADFKKKWNTAKRVFPP